MCTIPEFLLIKIRESKGNNLAGRVGEEEFTFETGEKENSLECESSKNTKEREVSGILIYRDDERRKLHTDEK